MSEKIIYENIPVIRNSLSNSASEHHLKCDNSLSSRFGESLPSMNTNNQQTTSIGTNLSRFPDEFTNLNDGNLDKISPFTISTSSTGQTNIGEDQQTLPPPYISIETHESEQTNNLSRWDDAWNEHEQKQQQEERNEIPPKNEKIIENIDITLIRPTFSPSTDITRVYVREFIPTSANDPTFSVLRNLFVRSFDEFYKQIETQLSLTSDKSLIQWLDETFDDEQQAILSKKYRCFILYGNEKQNPQEIILGFLTLKEEGEGSVYIAQVAVRLDIKRRGYGAQILQHLRNIYPPNTQYWGLCRRANRPALQFSLKQGAKFMKNDEVATKYGYDPALYAGFEFVDTIPVIASQPSSVGRLKPIVDNSDQQSTTITNTTQDNQNPSSANDGQQIQEPKTKNRTQIVRCCTII